MKRSTTPAVKDKPLSVKSQANLKLSSQLKILNKELKKNIITKNLSSIQSNSTISKNDYQQSFILRKNEPRSFIETKQEQNAKRRKDSMSSKLDSLNGSYSKKINSFNKYLSESNNPETQYQTNHVNEKEEGLTRYLLSKCWQNSEDMLSPQVNQEMRKLVTQWLIELSHYMKLRRETLYHTMWIIERCLQKITDLNAKNLQLLAITALFMSTKYEQIYPPHLIALIEKTLNSYHKNQVIDLQQKILVALNFQLTAPNRYTFLNLNMNKNSKYLQEYDVNQSGKTNKSGLNSNEVNINSNQKRYTDFVQYLLELTLLKSFSSSVSQKEIADAVIYLGNKVMKKQDAIFENENWLYLCKIQQIAYEIIQIWKQNQYSIVSFLYDCDKWSFVGGLTILF